MKKSLLLFLFSCCSISLFAVDATMYKWRSHFAYGSVTQVLDAGTIVYGLAGGALYSVDKTSEEIRIYTKQNGMNGGEIVALAYDDQSKTLILTYADGLIDFLHNDQFSAMTDLKQKVMTASKRPNKIVLNNGIAYFCMPFGIMAIDAKKQQVKDTYYIGENGAEVNVLDITFSADSAYAISSSVLYSIANNANWMDYINWTRSTIPSTSSAYQSITYWQGHLLALISKKLYQRKNQSWQSVCPDKTIQQLCLSQDQLFLIMSSKGIYSLNNDLTVQSIASAYQPLSIAVSGSTYWLATSDDGIVRQTASDVQSFIVNGPAVNIPYRLKIVNDKLYMLAGQRWAAQFQYAANIMMYDIQNDLWTNIYSTQVDEQAGMRVLDLMNVAVDPLDPEHYYITSYGMGVLECNGTDVVHLFNIDNSVLESALPGEYANKYVRCDGAVFDNDGNLWILNAGVQNVVHVANTRQLQNASLTGEGNWYKMPFNYIGSGVDINTPGELFIDSRHNNYKWIPVVRIATGLILLDDHSTPQYKDDDEAYYRSSFVDQDGNTIDLSLIYSIAQEQDGKIWVGMDNGIITIPADVDFKTSNRCERIKVPRNDGTGLADYLLQTDAIKAIAIDGSNRKWLGTAASGLYLVSSDGLETIYHFTMDNSPLTDNTILSLAIHPTTGRVFIGTSSGLMSYQSDASPAWETYSNVYAYPNPVRPDYEGVITIRGLMDESVVHIVDNAGNLVCETRSNGGLAIWDGKTANGSRAASGVYTVFLNQASGDGHAVTKILLMH